MTASLDILADRARQALGNAGTIHGAVANQAPRYELFHAAGSICAQKVRAIHAHHGMAFTSHDLNLARGQNYYPDYVRLRILGCQRLGGQLASVHTGSTSTASGGCDGAVVPTLIDWETREVIADSKYICCYLDKQIDEQRRLRPSALKSLIDEELDIIDHFPNYQLSMASMASKAGGAPGFLDASAFSKQKVKWCEEYLGLNENDSQLCEVYSAKRSKELQAANELFSAEALSSARARAQRVIDDLEHKLGHNGNKWLLADTITMADIFWGIELLRVKSIGGLGYLTQKTLPHVTQYSVLTQEIPALRTAVINWPGAMF